MRSWSPLLVLLWLVACSGESSPIHSIPDGDSRPAGDVVDLVADSAGSELPGNIDAGLDFGPGDPDLLVDVQPEVGPACAPGEGCFLDPCQENAECLSGWCVEHMGEGVCTQACQEECPPGWSCRQVGTGPDVVFICISEKANLCRPCAVAGDCKSPGGAEDVCVDYGDEGSFCGGACTGDDDCPWGFSCDEAVTVNGMSTWQCVAESGVCPCTGKSIALGLSTPCVVENEFGSCTGQRVCVEEGLSDCDAAIPATETCNGLDDNCDGDADEAIFVDGEYVNLCNDGNDCTVDTCLGEEGCQNEVVDGGECFDGNPCTVADHCVAGECTGTPVDCDDENVCTDDSCDQTGGCIFVPNNADCDDGDPCTVADECNDMVCSGVAIACDCTEDADCLGLEDGDLCNGTLVCATAELPYQCVVDPESIVVCPEPEGPDAACLAAACDPESGACSLVADNEGFACDDGDACTVGDHCQEGTCVAGVPFNCNDNNPCTADSCDAAGLCVYEPTAGDCDDGNACTEGDFCDQGACAYAGLVECDDGNVCTTDSCDPAQGCVHSLNSAPCDDNNLCTTGDHCHLGDCISSGSLSCQDTNPCTTDTCNPNSGCQFANNTAPCDDSNACTVDDACAGGSCKPGGALDCNDGDPCTDDSCDPLSGCVHTFNNAPCDDSDACTSGEFCSGGVCGGGVAVNCSDDNLCTDDSCHPVDGCVYTPNSAPCDDGSACTINDQCGSGSCQPGEAVVCDDANVCTEDSCEPETGCLYLPVPDGTPCAETFECWSGQCIDACETGTQTFNYTGSVQTWTVPGCVTQVTVEVYGAQGSSNEDSPPAAGPHGGKAAGTLAVTPGGVLHIYVGGSGDSGGWNGGGGVNGGWNGTHGGGASDVRVGGTTLNDRKIVAGGAGAHPPYSLGYGGWHGAQGGVGGGLSGAAGQNSDGNQPDACGGGGGTQNAGGAAGCDVGGNPSSAGTFGQGGEGGGENDNDYCGAGGGGGGGWYGGGGGGHHNCGGGGGGGGSSYVGGVTNGTTEAGVRSGHGMVVISY